MSVADDPGARSPRVDRRDEPGAAAGGRYVVLGLAGIRSPWFREVGRWATAATVPIEFVRCVSAEELIARLEGGRTFSALLVDAGAAGLDRDLLDRARVTGIPAFVVDDGRTGRDWVAIGAAAVMAADLGPVDLMDELQRHGSTVERVGDAPGMATADGIRVWNGHVVAVTGGAGAGASTLAMATAQGLADDPRNHGSVVLADLALDADQAMYHDARDIVPGLQELVDAHRLGTPTTTELRTMVFDAPDRGYHLLLGLRRHRDWAALRPRAVDATLTNLSASYRFVVADVEPDLEGDAEVGAIEIEERNLLSRATVQRADLVLAVGTPEMKGMNDLLRVIADLIGFGVEPARIVPVINRSSRPGRSRADVTGAFGELVKPICASLLAPLHITRHRRLETTLRDGGRLPESMSRPLATTVSAIVETVAPRAANSTLEPVAVTPGSLGHFADDEDLS